MVTEAHDALNYASLIANIVTTNITYVNHVLMGFTLVLIKTASQNVYQLVKTAHLVPAVSLVRKDSTTKTVPLTVDILHVPRIANAMMVNVLHVSKASLTPTSCVLQGAR